MRHQFIGIGMLILAITIGCLTSSTAPNAFDAQGLSWLAAHRTEHLTGALLALTNLLTPVSIVLLALIAGLLAWWMSNDKRTACYVIGVVGFGSVFTQVLKHVFQRSRPETALQVIPETDFSFPSGHVTGMVALSTAIVVVIVRFMGKQVGLAAAFFGITLSLSTAFARVYLGDHWPTDVIAGALIGMGTAFTGLPALKMNRGKSCSGDSRPTTEHPQTLERKIRYGGHGLGYEPRPTLGAQNRS